MSILPKQRIQQVGARASSGGSAHVPSSTVWILCVRCCAFPGTTGAVYDDTKLWSDWGSAAFANHTSFIVVIAIQRWHTMWPLLVILAGHGTKRPPKCILTLMTESMEEVFFWACRTAWLTFISSLTFTPSGHFLFTSLPLSAHSTVTHPHLAYFSRCAETILSQSLLYWNQRAPLRGCRKLTGESVVMLPVVFLTVV